MNRRDLLKRSTSMITLGMCPGLWSRTACAKTDSPHRTVYFMWTGGLDQHYFFDSRPKSLVAAGLMTDQIYSNGAGITRPEVQDLLDQEPEQVEFANGKKTWVHPSTAPLRPLLNELAVVNGIIGLIGPDSDSHDANEINMLTGSGRANTLFTERLKDQNDQSVLYPHITCDLRNGIQGLRAGLQTNVMGFNAAMSALAKSGLNYDQSMHHQFLLQKAAASADFDKALLQSANIPDRLRQLDQKQAAESVQREYDFMRFGARDLMTFIHTCFELDLSRNIVIDVANLGQFDTHGVNQAQQMPQVAYEISEFIAAILTEAKRLTVSKAGDQSIFDLATFVFTTEFSRTNFSQSASGDREFRTMNDGNDHNPYGNSAILFGRGIKGGSLAGATDCQPEQAKILAKVAGQDGFSRKFAENSFELNRPTLLKNKEGDLPGLMRMGVPVFEPTPQQTFYPSHYITSKSLINTLWTVAGVRQDRFLNFIEDDRSKQAPVIKEVLT